MFGRVVVIVALVAYLFVLGCVLSPHAAPAENRNANASLSNLAPSSSSSSSLSSSSEHGSPTSGLPLRSIGMQVQRVDWIDRYKQSIDEIAAVGADTVLLVVDSRQENGTSSRIYLDMRMTPTPAQLADLIQHAKSRGLRVVLMPIVLLDAPRGNEWRGTLKPENWDEWFDSYRAMIKHFAWIAEGNGVDLLVVGSELVSSESNIEQWTQTIGEVRDIYKGKITYSSNWDHYTSVPFWDQLDLVGMNSYWKLGKDRTASVEEIEQHWRNIQGDLIPFLKKVRKPLMFLEVGWCSLANAAHEPWDYTKVEEPVDLDLQKRLYEGFFNTWYGNPHLGGFNIWEWTPGDGGSDDRGYTPENKPAEQVLRHWLSQPPWDVK